jgi:hypothetical protein
VAAYGDWVGLLPKYADSPNRQIPLIVRNRIHAALERDRFVAYFPSLQKRSPFDKRSEKQSMLASGERDCFASPQ